MTNRRTEAHHPPADAVPLETLAVLGAFAALPKPETHLADWIRCYPEQAEALAAFVMETHEGATAEPVSNTDVQPPVALSPSTQRALELIFDAPDTPIERRVAEEPGQYRTTATDQD
jgi:hypothetical protein